jgi:hypothetical protein
MRLERVAALILATTLAAGCPKPRPQVTAPQGAEAREAVLLTTHTAPGRHCTIVDANAPLPAIGTLLDTAAMPDYLKQASVAPDSGYALYSLRFDSTGHPVRARLIEATIAPELVAPLQQAIGSALLDRGDGHPLAARLRIDFAPSASYRLGKSEYCDPEEIRQQATQTITTATVAAGPGTTRMITARIKYELVISPNGVVSDVRFANADPRMYNEVSASLQRQLWKPALDDALPVEGRVKGELKEVVVARPTP